jgi:23S rRNA (pseudouridine1915-N3)-methyltransferase
MKLTLLTVGKIKEVYLSSAIQDYIMRLKPFAHVTIHEVKESLLPDKPSLKEIDQALAKEADALERLIQPKDGVIVLDLHQPELTSLQLAKQLQQWQMKSHSWVFVIGSSFGLSKVIKDKASFTWTLSSLTFPHGLVRLLVLEQLYRAFKINAHQTYHK